MGDTTTLSTNPDVKDRLEEYRHPDHASWTDTFESIMAVLPTYEELAEEGCAQCDDVRNPAADPLDEQPGVLSWFVVAEEHGGGVHANWFCSRECHGEFDQMIQNQVPEEPDLVRVGGRSRPVVEVENANFTLEGGHRSLSIPIPGALSGTDYHDNPWDYEGEPAYIQHNGRWIHSGAIETVDHDEEMTYIDMSQRQMHPVAMENHPDEAERQRWLENRQEPDAHEVAERVVTEHHHNYELGGLHLGGGEDATSALRGLIHSARVFAEDKYGAEMGPRVAAKAVASAAMNCPEEVQHKCDDCGGQVAVADGSAAEGYEFECTECEQVFVGRDVNSLREHVEPAVGRYTDEGDADPADPERVEAALERAEELASEGDE